VVIDNVCYMLYRVHFPMSVHNFSGDRQRLLYVVSSTLPHERSQL
jgi:hypothetical protein